MFFVIWYAILFTVFVALIYVWATYMMLAYDRCLARNHLISPTYLERGNFPSGGSLARGFILEVVSIFAVIWLYSFAVIFPRPWKSARRRHGRPIILVHGYKHNQSGWILMRRRLKRAGFGPIYSLNLRLTKGGLPSNAERIAALVEKIDSPEVILIGHSMGGLVAAYYAECLAPPNKVSHLIAMASPFQGTRLAVLNFGKTARQMRPGSAFLRDLDWRISSDGFTRYYQIATRFDNMVFPYQSALTDIDPRYQMTLTWQGHMTLIFSKKVSNQIIHWLQATSSQRTLATGKRPKKPLPLTA